MLTLQALARIERSLLSRRTHLETLCMNFDTPERARQDAIPVHMNRLNSTGRTGERFNQRGKSSSLQTNMTFYCKLHKQI